MEPQIRYCTSADGTPIGYATWGVGGPFLLISGWAGSTEHGWRHSQGHLFYGRLAMVGRLGLKAISNANHPYPTQAEAIKRAADTYNRIRLTPSVKKLFERFMAGQR